MIKRNLFFIVLSVLFSCEETLDCDNVLSSNQLKVEFFNGESRSSEDRVFIEIRALNTTVDTILFDTSYAETGYRMPLNYNAKQTVFTFLDSTNVVDTLTISYQTKVEFFGEDCGAIIDFSDLNVVKTTFDSTVLIDNTLTKVTEINIEIYD